MGRKFDFEFTPLTLDQLQDMTEEDLYTKLNKFKRLIRESQRAGRESLPFETEYCYLEHERIMRTRFSRSSRPQRPQRPQNYKNRRR